MGNFLDRHPKVDMPTCVYFPPCLPSVVSYKDQGYWVEMPSSEMDLA